MQIATLFRAHVLNSSEAWCNLAKASPEKYSPIAQALIGAKIADADSRLDTVLGGARSRMPEQRRVEDAVLLQAAFLKTFRTVRNDATNFVGQSLSKDSDQLHDMNRSIHERLETADHLLTRMERYRALLDSLPKVDEPPR